MRAAAIIRRSIQILLITVLGISVFAKVGSGYTSGIAISQAAYWGSVAIDILAISLIAIGYFRAGLAVVIALACGGILIALMADNPCGCFGRLIMLDRYQHMLVSSAMGSLAALLLLMLPARVNGF